MALSNQNKDNDPELRHSQEHRQATPSAKTKWLATGFSLFIILVIYLANTKQLYFVDDIVRTIPHGDKICHFLFMGMLAYLVNMALGDRPLFRWRIGPWVILCGTTIVAVLVTLEEFSQMFIDTRTFNPMDLVADYLGFAIANTIAYRKLRQRPTHSVDTKTELE